MATASKLRSIANVADLPSMAWELPVIYEDDGQEEMGESEPHTRADHILFSGLDAHMIRHPQYKNHRVFSNLNLYYHMHDRWAYVSPDTMVVVPFRKLRANVRSYRIGKSGPAPVLTAEVLSERSYQQQDLTDKPQLYADLGVSEYMLIDTTGEFLSQKLLLMRLQRNRTWKTKRDADGGVTTRLGFRVVIDHDNQLRVIDAISGRPYVRPEEAQAEAEARLRAERRVRELEEELVRLRGTIRARKKNGR